MQSILDKIQYISKFALLKKKNGSAFIPSIIDYTSKRKKSSIGFSEYFTFKLYDKNYPEEYRNDFLGSVNHKLYLDYLNPKHYSLLAGNKYLTKIYLQSLNIPTSDLLFVFDPKAGKSSEHIFTTYSEVIDYFKKENPAEFVCKPLTSSHGIGVDVFTGWTFKKDDVILKHINNNEIFLESYLKNNSNLKSLIFERRIKQSDYINEINFSSVNTLRIVTLLFPDGDADVLTAFLRMGRKNVWFDNAFKGGNIDASINTSTGQLEYPISFKSFDNITDITHHPDSKIDLTNFCIKDWDYIIKQVKEFQQKTSLLKAIAWDVAITDDGPVIIEINHRWDLTGQIFVRKGWYSLLKKCYDSWINSTATS